MHIYRSTIFGLLYLGIAHGQVFCLTVNDISKLNTLDVGCVLIVISVLDA